MADLNHWFARMTGGKTFKEAAFGSSPAFWNEHPKRAWPLMLGAMTALLAGTLAVNIGIFLFFSRAVNEASSAGFDVTKITIDRSVLTGVVQTLDERAARFQNVLKAPAPGDPSL